MLFLSVCSLQIMAEDLLARLPILLDFSPMPKTSHPVHEVLLLVYDQVQLLDFAGPLQTFATAEERSEEETVLGPGSTARFQYVTRLISENGGKIVSSSGVEISTSSLPETLNFPSTIIVAGGWGVKAASQNQRLVNWLQSQSDSGHRICSVCTGAFILAEAGLLNGKRATTHWASCDEFAAKYPQVKLDPKAIYTENDHIWTSAGITAGIDLALALIERDRSSRLANMTARWLVVYAKRAGGQSQFSEVIEFAHKDEAGVFADLHAWISENTSSNLTLSVLAERASMSERTFSRKYKSIIGVSPAKSVRLIRAQAARNILLATEAPLKAVSRQSGFQSVDAMNTALREAYGVSARLIRETNRGV